MSVAEFSLHTEVSLEQSMPTSPKRSHGFRSLIGQNNKKSRLAGSPGAPLHRLQFMTAKMLESSTWKSIVKGVWP